MTSGESRLPDHSWQAGRRLAALATDYFRVDERSEADLIAMAIEYARLLSFFDVEKAKDEATEGGSGQSGNGPADGKAKWTLSVVGTWESFFHDDVSFLLAQICTVDAAQEYRESLAHDGEEGESDLLKQINTAATRLKTWWERAQQLSGLTVSGSVDASLVLILDTAIKKELRDHLFPKDKAESLQDTENTQLLDLILHMAGELPESGRPEASDPDLRTIYSALNRVTAQVVKVARDYLATTLNQKSDHPPHTGLYLAFVSLLLKSQAHLNELTERHLLFYYKKVLRLSRSAGTPDQADVSFRLSPQMKEYELPAGTALSAGDTPEGPVIYRTDEALAINRASLVAFKALNIRRRTVHICPGNTSGGDAEDGGTREVVRTIRAFPIANSADGFGTKLDAPSTGWPPFGPTHSDSGTASAVRSHAEIGVAFASPILDLREGEREIELLLSFSSDPRLGLAEAMRRYREQAKADYECKLSNTMLRRLVADAILLSVTTKSGFRRVSRDVVEVDVLPIRPNAPQDGTDPTARELRFRFVLKAAEPAMEPPEEDTPEARLSAWPTLKLHLNPDAKSYAYSALSNLVLVGARITARVRGLRSLSLQTNDGPVDASKPFPPFGAVPVPGAYMLFANRELWRKRLTRLRLNLTWVNLPRPPRDLVSHYAGYGLDTENDSFRAAFSVRSDFHWQPLPVKDEAEPRKEASVALFPAAQTGGGLASRVAWQLDVAGLEPIEGPAVADDGPLAFDQTTASGFFRLELTEPDYGFGHAVYPRVLAEVAAANAKPAQSLLSKVLGKLAPPRPLPEPPFVPLADNVSVDYEASTELGGRAAPDNGEILHLHPFGQMTVTRDGHAPFGSYQHDGFLFLGLRDLRPPQTLTLLFHLHESSAEQWSPASGYARPKLGWSYLTGNRWVPLPNEAILADHTRELLTSGIVKLALPRDISDQNTILSPGLFWLSISVDGDPARYGRIVSVTTQAVTATRVLQNTSTSEPPVASAGSITKLADATPQIAAISQPYASIGGRAAESEGAFRTRVSERLRHKQRAVQQGDFERLVLQAFPEIHEARCIRYRPGQAVMVVTPVRDSLKAVERPAVSLKLRREISGWLHDRGSEWAEHIIVRNPSYEVVKVVAHVAPSRAADASFVRRLEDALTRLIAPWRSDPELPMAIGTGFLDLAAVHAFMENQPFVHEVVGLSMVQSFRTRPGPFLAERHGLKDTARVPSPRATLSAATPWSVLIPARQHDIRVLEARRGIGDLRIDADFRVSDPREVTRYRDDDSRIPLKPTQAGIGNLAIGRDLIVTTCDDATPPSSWVERDLDAVMAMPVPQS